MLTCNVLNHSNPSILHLGRKKRQSATEALQNGVLRLLWTMGSHPIYAVSWKIWEAVCASVKPITSYQRACQSTGVVLTVLTWFANILHVYSLPILHCCFKLKKFILVKYCCKNLCISYILEITEMLDSYCSQSLELFFLQNAVKNCDFLYPIACDIHHFTFPWTWLL